MTAPHATAAYTLKTALLGGRDLGYGYPGGVRRESTGGGGIEEVAAFELGTDAARGSIEDTTLDTT